MGAETNERHHFNFINDFLTVQDPQNGFIGKYLEKVALQYFLFTLLHKCEKLR